MSDVKEEVKTVAHNAAHPEDETRKEARKRQPWMPILGSIIVGVVLLLLAGYFIA